MRKITKLLVLLLFVVSIIVFMNKTSSRYLSETNFSGTVSIARPYVALNATNIPTQEMHPNQCTSFEFTVDNFEGNNVSEVPMNYYIYIYNKTYAEADPKPATYPYYYYNLYDITDDPNNPVEIEWDDDWGGFPISMSGGTAETKTFLIELWFEGGNIAIFDTTWEYSLCLDSAEYYNDMSQDQSPGYKISRHAEFYAHVTTTYYNNLTGVVTETDMANVFDIQITNTNPEIAGFSVCANYFNAEYLDWDSTLDVLSSKPAWRGGWVFIPANSTANIRVKFTLRPSYNIDEIGTTESDGEIITRQSIKLYSYEWTDGKYDSLIYAIVHNIKFHLKTKWLMLDALKIGEFVAYTPSPSVANDTYTVLASYSGTDANQNITLTPDLNWRILNINKTNNTVDLISGLSTTDTLTLKGAQGYNNGVEILNDACNSLYGNSTIGATARSINMQDVQEKLISETTITEYVEKDTLNPELTVNEYGVIEQKTDALFYPTRWYDHDRIYSGTKSGITQYFSESATLIEGTNLDPATTHGTNPTVDVRSNYYKKSLSVINELTQLLPDDAFSISSVKDYTQIYLKGQRYDANYSWLATRYVSPFRTVAEKVYFGLMEIDSGTLNSQYLYTGIDSSHEDTNSLRPIVTLPVEYINLDETVSVTFNLNENTEKTVSAWKVENTSVFDTTNNPSSGE